MIVFGKEKGGLVTIPRYPARINSFTNGRMKKRHSPKPFILEIFHIACKFNIWHTPFWLFAGKEYFNDRKNYLKRMHVLHDPKLER